MERFNPLEPFANKRLFNSLVGEIKDFHFKLYGKLDLKFYRGKKNKREFDLNLGVMHFTELDFKGLSKIFERMNKKWGTQLTFCIYPSKESDRKMIMNVRSPKASFEID